MRLPSSWSPRPPRRALRRLGAGCRPTRSLRSFAPTGPACTSGSGRPRRAAGRRALELPAGEGDAARPAQRAPEVHRVRGELGAAEAADLYDEELKASRSTLALNGIGPDGHTASLFPRAPGLDETERRAVAAEAQLDPFVPRVTMTPPVFAAARLLVYLVLGEARRRWFAAPSRTSRAARSRRA